MPRSEPHPLALFSLIPLNDKAEAVLNHPDNSHLVSLVPGDEQVFGIEVGFHIKSSSRCTLATIGRNGDITVEESSISRIQCSFEIHEEFGTVILYDRSNSQTTQVFGTNRTPFEPGRIRRIAVAKSLNTVLGMAGKGCNLIQFKLEWHQRMLDPKELFNSQVENARQARTVDEAPTEVPSARLTRIHTPSNRGSRLRCARMNQLGQGQFGQVYRAIEAETGRAMALKVVNRPTLGFEEASWISLKREIETLARISHVSHSAPFSKLRL